MHDLEELIQFFEEDITMPDFFSEEKVRHWLFKVAGTYHKEIDSITYIFCNDSYLLDINRQYLDHDDLTDIITFPYDESDHLQADIFISIERVADNAHMLGTSYEEELHRVMVHGLLHLCGIKDKTDEDACKMRAAEDAALQVR